MRRKSDPSYLRRRGATSMLMSGSTYGCGAGGYYGNGALTNTELAKDAIASRSVTSVDLSANTLFNGNLLSRKNNLRGETATSSAGSIGNNTQRSSSIITANTSPSRPLIPYLAQISDSGFSSFSSCSYLPPPPPYRQRSIVANSGGGSVSLDTPPIQKNENISTNIFNEIANSCAEPREEAQNLRNHNNVNNQLNVFQSSQSSHRIHRSLSDSKYKSNLVLKPNFDDGASSRKTSTGTISSLSVHSGFGSVHQSQRSLTHGDSSDCALSKQSVLITSDGLLPNPYPLTITTQQQLPKQQSTSQRFSNEDVSVNNNNSLSAEPTTTPSIVLTRVKKNNRYSNRSSSIWTSDSQVSLSLSPSMSTVSCPEYPEIEEKLHRLAMARDSLSLQVSVLNEQVGVQKEKIQDLETLLDSRRNNYSYKILSEQSLAINENSKSELINEISLLKKKFFLLEKEKLEAEHRLQLSQVEIKRLQNVQNPNSANNLPELNSRGNTPINLNSTNTEIENLRLTVQRLIADNEQKNIAINSLQEVLDEQNRVQRNNFERFGSHSISNLYANANSTSTMGVSNTMTNLIPPNFDINTQLRKLLLEDSKENIAHSSSYPIDLCNSVSGGIESLNNHSIQPQQLQQQQYPADMIRGGYWPTGFGPSINNIQPSTSYASVLSSAALTVPLGSQNQWVNQRIPISSPLFKESIQSQIPQQQQIIQQMRDLDMISSYRAPASPAARQLAAELDELRRNEFSIQQQQQQQQQQQMANNNNMYVTNSLPRTMFLKTNSLQLRPQQTQKVSQQKKFMDGNNEGISGEFIANNQTNSQKSSNSSQNSILNELNSLPQNKNTSKSTGNLRSWIQRKFGAGRSRTPLKLTHTKVNGAEKRSTSAPNLGPKMVNSLMDENYSKLESQNEMSVRNDEYDLESDDEMARSYGRHASLAATSSSSVTARSATEKFKRGRTRSTLRNFLGRLGRSNSQDLSRKNNTTLADNNNFRLKTPVRSSTNSRIASISSNTPLSSLIMVTKRPLIQHFVDFNSQQICEWFREIGLDQYTLKVEKCIRSGRHLINMSNLEFEKELLIKNSLHRKRLRCYLDCVERNTENGVEPVERMDVNQVLLWLDDIGLPQFRDAFSENLIDGHLLPYLTAQDLVEMKIISAMNHASIARGIQFLKAVDFNVHRMEKRFTPELLQKCPIASEVERWAHGCVVHWLKSIDLAEFTPNLMFSGLHGALMIHEPTFTAESLAEVLQIPVHKTLLRRHLTTHFNNLLGTKIIIRKRDVLAQPFVDYLSPTLKIKLLKKGFSLARKKSKQDVYVNSDEFVCPTNSLTQMNDSFLSSTDETSNV